LTKNIQVHLKGDRTAEQLSELILKLVDGKYPKCVEKITLQIGLATVVKTLKNLFKKYILASKNLKKYLWTDYNKKLYRRRNK
jgi:hypothetical protein